MNTRTLFRSPRQATTPGLLAGAPSANPLALPSMVAALIRPGAWVSVVAALLMSLPLRAGEPLSLLHLLPAPAAAGAAPASLLLLGEVHDNAQQHALRLQAFDALLQRGARPALLMEQFDRDRQDRIEHVRAQAPPGGSATATDADAQALIDAAATPGVRWHWDFYRPFIRLALEHGLPILAANVSRKEARRVSAQGLAATGFDERVPADLVQAQAALIVASHCGMVDPAQSRRMASAQIARDQFMARLLEQHRERGAVLLAGNGHVRRDIGVPRWLTPATRTRTLAIGLLEAGAGDHAAFDHALNTPAQPREDPCAAMRGKASAGSA